MPRMTPEAFVLYETRRAAIKAAQVPRLYPEHKTSEQREKDLHEQILAECKRRGWIALHGSMAHSTFRTEGEWDFTILADNGRMLMVECKTRTGKLSPAQSALHAWAAKLGHRVHVVRSLVDFLNASRSQALNTL